MWKEEITNQIDNMEDEIIHFLVDLIKIPTENPPGRNYDKITKVIGKKLEQFNYDNIQYIRVPEERLDELVPAENQKHPRVNLYAEYNSKEKEPVLHLNGHTDVVPAEGEWTEDPFEGKIKNGKIFGRGSSDQKSGLVAQIYAVEAFKRAGYDLNGSIEQSAVVDEETVGNKNAGMYYLVEKGIISKENTDHVVITECLDPDRICIGHRGALRFEVKTHGKQAHGSMPYTGVNAVDKMAKLLTTINNELVPRIKERITTEPVVPKESKKSSISVGTIKGGEATNLVPSECTAKFDRRLNPEETLEKTRKEFKNILKAISLTDPEFNYTIKENYATNPVLVPKNQKIVKAFQKGIKHQYNKNPDHVLSPGTDDQRFVVHKANIKSCIIYGPGRLKQAHTTNEHIKTEDLINGIKTMSIAIGELLGVKKNNK